MIRAFFLFTLLIVVACTSPSNKGIKLYKALKQSHQSPLIFPELPKSIKFAGETVVLTDEDILEKLDREVLLNAYYQSATTGYFKRAHRYFPLIERILKEENIPNDFKYLAIIESGLQQAVSPVGAQGFWQFMPATAKIYDLKMTPEIDERLHIEKSTRAACHYLKDAQQTLNNWIHTTASYNRGVGGVLSDMKWQGTTHYFDTEQNSETGRYVYRLLAMKIIFENPEAYGFYPKKMQKYEPIPTKTVTISESIPNLASWAIEQGINLKILRKLNPWLISTHLTIKNETYTFLLPAKSARLKPYSNSIK